MRIFVEKGFEYPVVDDIMINQTILSHENMLLPYVGIGLSTLLLLYKRFFKAGISTLFFLVLSYCEVSVFLTTSFIRKIICSDTINTSYAMCVH